MTDGLDFNPIITPSILEGDSNRLVLNFAVGDKGAAIGALYQMSLNLGSFIDQQQEVISADDKKQILSNLLSHAAYVRDMAAKMDEGDEFMWGECMEHMQLSIEARCPELLQNGQLVLGAPRIKNSASAVPFANKQPQ